MGPSPRRDAHARRAHALPDPIPDLAADAGPPSPLAALPSGSAALFCPVPASHRDAGSGLCVIRERVARRTAEVAQLHQV